MVGNVIVKRDTGELDRFPTARTAPFMKAQTPMFPSKKPTGD